MGIHAIQSRWKRLAASVAVALALIIMTEVEIGWGECEAHYSMSQEVDHR